MVSQIRASYNSQFSQDKYQAFLHFIVNRFGHTPPFRIAETPVFIPDSLKSKLIEACTEINDVICQQNFKDLTKGAIKHPDLSVPGEDYHTRFLQMDFGITLDENGDYFPKLIEIQGFPSLYFYQDLLSKAYKKFFHIPDELYVYLSGLHSDSYIALLKEIIVGNENPENVVLLEIEPEKQNTYIDFLEANRLLGIKILCVTKLKRDGKDLYYLNDQGKKIAIHRIYNRVIFDELIKRPDLKREFYFRDEVNVEWVGHPNWFFRISKYTMPLLKSKYVPECHYLDQLDQYPDDLNNFVLKPLYSFAGEGVRLNVTKKYLNKITDRDNYILQRRINYEPVIKAPGEDVKCEIRMLMLWKHGEPTALIVNNLARLSKGKMIGVRYNKNKDWVGASVGYFH